MHSKTLYPRNAAATQPTTWDLARCAPGRHVQRSQVLACAFGLLVLAPAGAFALELGEASVKSALGQALRVEIPYRLSADELIAPACIGLVPAMNAAALPAYTGVSRVSISPTHIEIVGDSRVLDPLLGLNVSVSCTTAPRFVRGYQLFVDPPVLASTRSSGVEAAARTVAASGTTANRADANGRDRSAASTTATSDPAPSAAAPSVSTTRSASTDVSGSSTTPESSPSRARGAAGGDLTQGQTYRVVRGDTLSGIAARVADRPTTILATADAIFAANPDAFARGDRNLLREGRSLTIPVLGASSAGTAASAAAPAANVIPAPATSAVPASAANVSPASPANVMPAPAANVAPVPPAPVERALAPNAAEVAVGAAGEPAPSTAPIAQPNDMPAAASASAEAPADATGSSIPAWLAGLIGIGVGFLLAAAVAFFRRRNQLPAAPAAVRPATSRRLADPVAGIQVVESAVADDTPVAARSTRVEPTADTDTTVDSPALRDDLVAELGSVEVVDLDVGAPGVTSDHTEIFAAHGGSPATETSSGDDTIEDNAQTVRIANVETAVRAQAPRLRAVRSEEPIDDEQMTLTIAEMDLLRQDYEAEFTMTQQASKALQAAVADLQATKAALAAADETATLEAPELPESESDEGGTTTAARVRMK